MAKAISTRTEIATPDVSEEMFKRVAMDVAKEVCAHIEVMYPESVSASAGTFLTSVRGSIYNEIMAVIQSKQDPEMRLAEREKFRKVWRAQYRNIRNPEAKP